MLPSRDSSAVTKKHMSPTANYLLFVIILRFHWHLLKSNKEVKVFDLFDRRADDATELYL